MGSIEDDILAARRLTVLRCLAEIKGHRTNEAILQRSLDLYGFRVSRDELREELEWLAQRDALTTSLPAGAVMVAELTRRGLDHVERRGTPIAGIAAPSPR